MAELTTNRLLPVLGVAALAVLLFVVLRTGFFDNAPEQVRSSLRATLPAPGEEPDADTPADTIRALQGELAQVREEYAQTRSSNDKLMQENVRLTQRAKTMRSELKSEMTREIEQSEQRQASRSKQVMNKLGAQMDRLRELLDQAPRAQPRRRRASAQEYGDIPVGLGLDSISGRDVIWVTPLDARTDEGGNLIRAVLRQPGKTPPAVSEEGDELAPSAFFTIPNLASLVGSTAFTAMIGRVPIGGQVRDPIPFRVLVGRDNLAASGLRVPDEIVGMVFEGTAVGDWTLSCVEGSLHTATFVFQDGTIRTVSTVTGKNNARPNVHTERLGYVADKFGTPCITGRKISNWKELMAMRVGLRTASAAAEAAAASETTTVVGGATGSITSAVDGDKGRFVLGRAVSEGIDEVDRAIAERLSNQFDAVFVENGKEIVLLIQKEIAIDFDPVGRKLDHAGTTGTQRTAYLD